MDVEKKRSPARLAVAGVGLVGKRHAEIAANEATLAAITDPAPSASEIATKLGVLVYPELRELLSAERPDGVIVATPNQRHEEDAQACIDAGIPVLVEKPLASDLASAERLVVAAAKANVPLLVGHHRRHNPIIAAAKQEIDAGRLGQLVVINAMCWLHKPRSYFDAAWRREPGAGPVFINLIHDVDLLIHLCGDIVAVQAVDSNALRGSDVEDTAAVLLRFDSGALGTVTVSDTVAAPWSWELTAGENPAYPCTETFAYMIGGTLGALSVPDLGLWMNEGEPGWHSPITRRTVPTVSADPLILQIRHFAEVALGRASPLVTGRDGLQALRIVVGIKSAARSGGIVKIEKPCA